MRELKFILNQLRVADASEKANTGDEQQQKVFIAQERLQEVKALGGDNVKLKEMSGADGVRKTMIGSEAEKMQRGEAMNKKCSQKESVTGPILSGNVTADKGQVRSSGKLLGPQYDTLAVVEIKLCTEHSPTQFFHLGVSQDDNNRKRDFVLSKSLYL